MVRPFSESVGAKVVAKLQATNKAMVSNLAARRRAESGQRRYDKREWVVQRRERTRHLIELGGLVQKSGLVELTDDDRATLYGAMLELAAQAGTEDGEQTLALWKRRGKRAFDSESEAAQDKTLADAQSGED